jgi:transposase
LAGVSIQRAGWDGGQHGWRNPTPLIFANALSKRPQEGLSRRRAALRFGVGASTVIKWMQRRRESGGIEPGQMGGHRPKKIAGGWRTWLVQRCAELSAPSRCAVWSLNWLSAD